MELRIVQRNGWGKNTKFDKAIVRIGSAPSNDIQLDSSGIVPIHLQIINAPETPGNCKVLNLGPTVKLESGGNEFTIESSKTVDLRDGDELVLGEYRILIRLPLASVVVLASHQIAASLSIGDAVLRPNMPTIGVLRLKNLGTHPNCQFQVVVNGLPNACFQIDPLPILYPGAEEDVSIRFFHRSIAPPAGSQVITVLVTAPASYPGEQVILQQGLYVSPLLKTGINLVDDLPVPRLVGPILPPLPEVNPEPLDVSINTQIPIPTSGTSDVGELQADPVLDSSEPATPSKGNISTPKLVRNPSESYWEERT